MKLALSTVQSTGNFGAELVEHGTLLDNLGAKDFIDFSNKNLASDSRVTLFIWDDAKKSNAPQMIACSERVSKVVRGALKDGADRQDVLAMLLELRVLEVEIDGETAYIISAPAGESTTAFSLNNVKRAAAINYEDYAVV